MIRLLLLPCRATFLVFAGNAFRYYKEQFSSLGGTFFIRMRNSFVIARYEAIWFVINNFCINKLTINMADQVASCLAMMALQEMFTISFAVISLYLHHSYIFS